MTFGAGGASAHRQHALFDEPAAPAPRGAAADGRLLPLVTWLPYVPGVGPLLAQRLRDRGVVDWRQLEGPGAPLPGRLRASAAWAARLGRQALDRGDADHFLRALPRSEHWRVAAAFPTRTLYLDIETTGLSSYYHRVTCVGWALGARCGALVLDGEDETAIVNGGRELQAALDEAAVLVTFNGAHFDIPFLRRRLPSIGTPAAHVDLRHTGRRTGLGGGQKRVEKELGLSRGDLDGMQGEDAPALWFRYQRGDLESLRLLLRYNHADVAGLRQILHSVAARATPGYAPDPDDACCRPGAAPAAGPPSAAPLRRYRGHVGPRLRLSDLPEADGLAVVGIDLAGSARGRTGWASVTGAKSRTAAVRTDEEILERTMSARPRLVSIDAPLSLPRGRLHVGDDDPGRAEFGIMRHCERELKRRGVNNYPALIQSMQALTARGIALATTLREQGVPVIESFPGAMQDILGIPRKGLSLDMLRQAVAEYGLTGAWETAADDAPATHDEVDALCCAAVGQMFWVGRYEALGTDDEDFLIVPDVGRRDGREIVVGVSGQTGAGKSTAVRILAERGHRVAGYSAALASRRPGASRRELQRMGEEVRQEPLGQRRLGQEVVAALGDAPRCAVDGLRFPEDHALMRERFGRAYVHVHVAAPIEERRKRFVSRGGTPDEYAAAAASSTEAAAARMRSLADRVIDNTASEDDLRTSLLKAVAGARGTA